VRRAPQPTAPPSLEAELPPVEPGADLARPGLNRGSKGLCFLLTLFVYVAFVPRFIRYSSPPTGDQGHYLMVAMSILQDHDLDVANNYARRDEDKFYSLAPHPSGFVGMEAPYPLPPHLAPTKARPPGEWHNFHLPGLSVMVIPSWIIGGWFRLWWPATVVFMCLLGALLMLNVFLLAHEVTGRQWIAWAVWLPLAFSNPIMSYSYLIFSELPTALLLVYALRRLAMGWRANGLCRRILIGLCIAWIP